MKYNVVNCPAYSKENFECTSYEAESICCYKNEDCFMKKIIIGKCNGYKESCKIENNCLDNRLCHNCFIGGANELADEIIDDLGIEEVED